MPKPVKKRQRRAKDPNQTAHSATQAIIAKTEGPDFRSQLSEYMRTLGKKGGKVSGAKRLEMPVEKRREIALKAARARWAKRTKPH